MSDRAPPLDGRGSEHALRTAFVRLARELVAAQSLGWQLRSLFERVPEVLQQGLVRLLDLLRELERDVLPSLRRNLRLESSIKRSWERLPRGGRIDAATTLRTALVRSGAPLPDEWLVYAAERTAATPVNLFAASILRTIAGEIGSYLAGDLGPLLRAERAALLQARSALDRFITQSPLGSLPPRLPAPDLLRQDAERRPGDLRRISRLVDAWEKFRAAAIRDVTWDERSLSPAFCYEGAAALALVAALAETDVAVPSADRALRFQGPLGTVEVHFEARIGRSRSPSVVLRRVATEGVVREVLVEARNVGPEAALEHVDRLEPLCTARAVVLLTPGAAEAAGLRLRWMAFDPRNLDDAMRVAAIILKMLASED